MYAITDAMKEAWRITARRSRRLVMRWSSASHHRMRVVECLIRPCSTLLNTRAPSLMRPCAYRLWLGFVEEAAVMSWANCDPRPPAASRTQRVLSLRAGLCS